MCAQYDKTRKSRSKELFNARIANRTLPYTLNFQKRSPLEDPNRKKITKKKQKLTLKLRNMSPFYI